MRLDDFQVKGSNSANLFNGFGVTEADIDSCTPKWDRQGTVTCTWNDIWRHWYSRMLISTNHCLRFENFQLKMNVSAYLFNGFGMTEVDTDTCTWNLDRQMYCHLHLIRHIPLLVLRNANRHQSLFAIWELWLKISNTANLFNGFGWTEVDTDTCTWDLDRGMDCHLHLRLA